jgi:protocatechuate 3,4-dioxygenase beta subunit
MLVSTPQIGRRDAVVGIVTTAAVQLMRIRPIHAEAKLLATPRQTEGPFYPREWQGDIDNDLVIVRGEAAKARGQVVHVEGRVLALSGQPIAGATVEIWQCDSHGIYRHPDDEGRRRRRDAGFQGRGRTATGATGEYRFRTIRPVAYGPRTPHIHFKVIPPAGRPLVTQMYVFGEPLNARDGVLNAIADRRQRESVIVRLDPADRIEAGALMGSFDIVLA